jgi:hypothetical protein
VAPRRLISSAARVLRRLLTNGDCTLRGFPRRRPVALRRHPRGAAVPAGMQCSSEAPPSIGVRPAAGAPRKHAVTGSPTISETSRIWLPPTLDRRYSRPYARPRRSSSRQRRR